MDIYVYSDESGVFDKKHNDVFVFGGLVFLSKKDKDDAIRLYKNAENTLRNNNADLMGEIKASRLSNAEKKKLFRSLNRFEKFGAISYQKDLDDGVFVSKKQKQRYLDWLYKMAIKEKLRRLEAENKLILKDIYNLIIQVDEHSTATDGIYELRESIEHEFKDGIMQYEYNRYIKPFLPNLNSVRLDFKDSKTNALIRASDIVANQLYNSIAVSDFRRFYGRNMTLYVHPRSFYERS